ncbi:uncharacterized protein SAPINGB_P003839 [Magnusiomyces paraingens]|uniref:Rho-GAP domain-containing protein n=1 Tax=Magnusiomyces paraingens TaxID=2606893 RepID=A0A5E8BYU3_9ASCO|nr:uncharacterized protein SAPINGB_P003839 [Saprochaete ingens]VVT53965.1 unnamed protein product [Saprochaete ingens]
MSFISKLRPKSHGSPREDYLATVADGTQQPQQQQQPQHNHHPNVLLHGHHSHHHSISSPICLQSSSSAVPVPSSAIPIPYSHSTSSSPPPVTSPGHILLSPPQSSFSSLLTRPRLYMSHSSSAVTTTSSNGHLGSHHHSGHHSNLQQSTAASDIPTSSSLQRISHLANQSSSPPVQSYFSSLSANNNFSENHIFGVPLETSIKYASSNIILKDKAGKEYVYGQIPIIVSKCSYFLKKNAANTEGIFRLSGSARRIKELQAIFSDPPAYGKSLDWVGFNVHDAANVLRRYLNNLPEPIVPLDQYDQFRKPLSQYPVIIEHLQGNQSISATSPGFISPSTNPLVTVSAVPESNLETVSPLTNTATDMTTITSTSISTEIVDTKTNRDINGNNDVNNLKTATTTPQLLSGLSDVLSIPEAVNICSNNNSTGNISFHGSLNSSTGSSSDTSEVTPRTEDTVSPTTPTTPMTTTKDLKDKLSSGTVLPQPPSSSTQNLSSTSSLLLPSTSTSPSLSSPITSYSQQPQAQSSTPIISSKPSALKSDNDNEKLQEETVDAIELYKQLLETLPPLNRQLLLYILDLLAFFAKHWQFNLMPAVNLAAIFQPSLLSHPSHSMIPSEYHLSRAVVQFLIEHFHSLVPVDLDPDKAKTSNTTKDPRPRHHFRRHSKSMSSVNIPSQVTSYLESSKTTNSSNTTVLDSEVVLEQSSAINSSSLSPPSSSSSAVLPSSHTNSFATSISNLAKRSVSPVQTALTGHIKNRATDNASNSTGSNYNAFASTSEVTAPASSMRSRALSPSRHSVSAPISPHNPPGSPPLHSSIPLATPAVATTGIFSALKRASSITRRKRAPSTSANSNNLANNLNSSTVLSSAASTPTINTSSRQPTISTPSFMNQTSTPNSVLNSSEQSSSTSSKLLTETVPSLFSTTTAVSTPTVPTTTYAPTSMLIPDTESTHVLQPDLGPTSMSSSSTISNSISNSTLSKALAKKSIPSSMLIPESLPSPISSPSEHPDPGNAHFSSAAMSSSSSLTASASALSYGSTSSAAAIITATSTATVKKSSSDDKICLKNSDSCSTFTTNQLDYANFRSESTPTRTLATSTPLDSSDFSLGTPIDYNHSNNGGNVVAPESALKIPEITTSKVDDLKSEETDTVKRSKISTSLARSINLQPPNTTLNPNFGAVGGFSSGSSSDEAEPVNTVTASTQTEFDVLPGPPILQLPLSSNNASNETIGTESGRSKFRRHRKRMSQSLSNMSNRLTRRSLSPLAKVEGGNTSCGELGYRNITPSSLAGNNFYGNISSGGSSPLSLAASSSVQSLQQQTDSREQQSLDNAIASMSLSGPSWPRNNSTESGNCAFSSESSIDCESDGDYDESNSSLVYQNTSTVSPVAIDSSNSSNSSTGFVNTSGFNNNNISISSSDTGSLPTSNKPNVSLWRRSLIAINIPVTTSSSSAPASATTTSLSICDQETDSINLSKSSQLSPRTSPINDDNTSIMTAPTLGSSPNSRQGWLHRPFKVTSRNNSRSQLNSDDERAPI